VYELPRRPRRRRHRHLLPGATTAPSNPSNGRAAVDICDLTDWLLDKPVSVLEELR
jgi:hypothetical protein